MRFDRLFAASLMASTASFFNYLATHFEWHCLSPIWCALLKCMANMRIEFLAGVPIFLWNNINPEDPRPYIAELK